MPIAAGAPVPASGVSIVGFDSAWTDNPKAPGAVCVLRSAMGNGWEFEDPRLALFDQALECIRREAQRSKLCLVAIDQPTIVPNLRSSRPVDKVAASLISFVGGGVQPANRSKLGMFDDAAPIWKFKKALGGIEDPERARTSQDGLFLIEVFPALSLPSFEPRFHGYLAGPRYNPERRKTYQHEHWLRVIDCIEATAHHLSVSGIDAWCRTHRNIASPRKADQDLLDAVLCALTGLHWLVGDRSSSVMIGDLETGYMIAPASPEARVQLERAARQRSVLIDGIMLHHHHKIGASCRRSAH
jgi:predicted RNase H-like nuclease